MLSLLFRMPLDLDFKPHLSWLWRQEFCWPSSICFPEWTSRCIPLVETLKRQEPLLPFKKTWATLTLCSIPKINSFREVPGLIWDYFWLEDCHRPLSPCRSEVLSDPAGILGKQGSQGWTVSAHTQREDPFKHLALVPCTPRAGWDHQEVNSAEGDKCLFAIIYPPLPTQFFCHWKVGGKHWAGISRAGIEGRPTRCDTVVTARKTTSSVTLHTIPAISSLSWLHFSGGSVNFSSWQWSKARPMHGYRSDLAKSS